LRPDLPLTEPPRLAKFREQLVKAIPRVPNNMDSLQHMRQKQLPELVIDYVNWRSRYVGIRPRTVKIEPLAKTDPRWRSNLATINLFLAKVQRGDDLIPHLSNKPHTRGYAVVARRQDASSKDKWSDKDLILNATGYHHFHLGPTIGPAGDVVRTDNLIFAHVGRGDFTVVAIFDHCVFRFGSPERERLVALHNAIVTRGMAPGSVAIGASIATSGHTTHTLLYAQRCLRLIGDLEPKLDDREFVRSLYKPREHAPANPRPEWRFCHLDLAIYDRAKPAFLIVQQGWN
jgi:hypothetical protein